MNNDILRASSAQRYALCPGSYAAEYGLRSTASDAAARGSRIHAMIADIVAGETIRREDVDDYEVAHDMAGHVLGLLRCTDPALKTERQLAWPQLGWSGKPDLVAIHRDYGLVFDYKTGRQADLPDPDINAQLRVYAVLASHAYGLSDVTCYLIAEGRKPIGPCVFDTPALHAAAEELSVIRQNCLAPNAPRCPSEVACHWCPAFGRADRCPDTARIPAVIEAETPTILERLPTMPAQELADLARKCILLRRLADAAEVKAVIEECKIRLESSPDAVPGYALRNTGCTRTVADAWQAIDACRELGIPPAAIDEALSLSPAALEKALTDTGVAKKAAKALVAKALAGLVVETPKAKALVAKTEVAE